MVVLFVAGLAVCDLAERSVLPELAGLGLSGGNREGKEVRFGVGGSVLTAVVTSNGATGSGNAMHDSFRPLGVLVPLVNMLPGEVTFGGLGTALVGGLRPAYRAIEGIVDLLRSSAAGRARGPMSLVGVDAGS